MKIKYFLFLGGLLWANLQAASLQGLHFEHKDWEVSCDNTGTCRVAGYQSEYEYDKNISVLFTRKAGEKHSTGELTLLENHHKNINLIINQKNWGKLSLNKNQNYALSHAQVQAMMTATKKQGRVQIQTDKKTFELSNLGAAAVWLKADEFQQFGKLKPQAKPIIHQAKTVSGSLKISKNEQNPIRQLLRQKWDADTCHELHETQSELAIYPLDSQNKLAETKCWSGAYNVGYAYAVLDNTLKNVRQLITTNGSNYQNGRISGQLKSRGIGDCWGGEEWVWDGKKFVQSADFTTGMCRGFAGGAWFLPTWVADVKE